MGARLPVPSRVVVEPASRLAGRLRVPGDKSVSHRVLMLASLCQGESRVGGLLQSEDVFATAGAMRAMGARIELTVDGRCHVVGRGSDGLTEPRKPIDCGNSGTTMRLLSGLIAGQGLAARLIGDASLSNRPMARIVRPLRAQGHEVVAEGPGERPPLRIDGRGGGDGDVVYDSPIASAQVKSCVLLSALRQRGVVEVREPAASRDHTERLLRYLGRTVDCSEHYEAATTGAAWVRLRPADADAGAPAGRDFVVPGDISSAAFWLVAAALTKSHDAILEGISVNPTRTGVLAAFQQTEVGVVRSNERVLSGGEPVADLSVRVAGAVRPFRLDGSLIPRLIDEIPVLAVLALGADGVSVVADAAELRVKESDRLAATARLLKAAGADVEELEDGLRIRGPQTPRGFSFDAAGDHRLAMAAAVLALVADGPSEIHGAEACAVSYAEFFEHLTQLTSRGNA